MDHAEAIESEGHAPQNEIGEDLLLRGNSTEPTANSMADGGDEAMAVDVDVDVDGLTAAHLGWMDIDATGIEEGSMGIPADGGPFSTAAVELTDTSLAPLMSTTTPAAAPDGDDLRVEASQAEQQPPSDATDATQREPDLAKSLIGGPPAAGPVEESAASSEAIRATEVYGANESTPQPTSHPLVTLSAENLSFDQGQAMSVDEEDNDIISDKASSVDAQSESDAAPPPPQDQTQASQHSERAPLENAYGPFIHPSDTSLSDARERLHVALEQTRLLRASFAEQAYERYLCVMKPVPESLAEVIEPILSDPHQVAVTLRAQADAIKVEKDMEKKQAQQAGVGLEELAYFGEGLHLVFLPEDEVDETEIDLTQFPHRGPTDPRTGERREDISAAAAATTEQVFDRIRRIRAIRMGADISEAGIPQASAHVTRNPAQDQLNLNESFSSGFAAAPLSSSPAPSVDSNAGEAHQRSSKVFLRHLLTLAPGAEGARPDGSFTAVQSALIARGVGMNEMKHDLRINPLRQRMVQPNYFSPTPSHKCLPPLLGPHQLYRLQAADARREGVEVRSSARDSIKSVVEAICLPLGDSGAKSMGKSVNNVDDRKIDDSNGGDSGSGSIRKVLGEDHSALEIGLLRRMHSAMLQNQCDKSTPATSEAASRVVTETTDPGIQSLRSDSGTGDFDPLLAFSVMSAVGLVRNMEGNGKTHERTSHLDQNRENSYAQALGLDGLTGIESVSQFFHTNLTTGNGRKRRLSGADGTMNDTKKSKVDNSQMGNGDKKEDCVYQIRGGGGQDEANFVESKAVPKESSETKKQKNGVSQTQNQTGAPTPDPSLAGYASFDPVYNAMSQVPLGDKQSQNVIAAAAASRQLLQHQLSVHPDPYHTATLGHQLTLPIGSHLSALPSSEVSDFYLRNGLAGNPDWLALGTTNPAARADVLAQHSQLTASLGLLPGQMNLSLPEQETARALFLRDHHHAAAARAHGAVAAAHYQASLSSINPQNPYGFDASSLSQVRSNETQFISSLPASYVKQQKGTSPKILHRKRSLSLSGKSVGDNSNKKMNTTEKGKSDQTAYVKRPASAPPSPPNSEVNSSTPEGGLCTGISSTRFVSHVEASTTELNFDAPPPPKGLRQEIADLISHAKFHEAHSLYQKKSDDSKALLIKFLLSLGAAVPIPKEFIADPLAKKLSTSNYQLRLHEFVGSSSSASASRDVIIAIISIWLWSEHKDCFKHTIVESGKDEADPSYKWLINLAIYKCLSALATFFDSHPSGKSDDPTKETPNEQVAAVASQSLSKKVFIDHHADASFPILEDLLKLLDSLRTDALRAKTQERVLLAALASRCGNMSEAFSNAYVSSIVRAGVALGHENVCEIGQDEECRASTLLPYDFFHDNLGVWEEPCRPTTGYHPAVGGDELKKQAHARSVIQKSMKRLQSRLGLKGGISDGGPYFSLPPMNTPAPTTPTAVQPLLRTSSGSLKRRGSFDFPGAPGTGPQDPIFNPDHSVAPMLWNPNDVPNFPYGHHQLGAKPTGGMMSDKKKSIDGNEGDHQATSLAARYRSTQELEWEDVANMFFHGGSTRNIDIDYDFGSNDHLGKKKIFAPFVQDFNCSTLKAECGSEHDTSSDEDISDEAVIQRHQDGLDEMKLKLDAALESRKQEQQRGRNR
mmetsp:Transcript_32815/g.69018  ORF Transcript_32815/g.69018 Transcript_32815/m.69018 type:complete len:1658 (+) Transcript_32815:135-5108(+)|eukprot:CAMPEP_0172321718 /NCGR_PEP_ID=MMETSP1058-20130122/44109_1 /TAXON_ID=83371 /ORGANISM="Detonula confervacea, Strain CCMP 353" /LENGTH=1657 /DNA_ID=CAMNT_0013037303 /DNA_START=38 /DNA_END=5011 /DNA_ORIENTATION=-